jgi:Tfp pilus assembly protein PilV
MRIKLHHTDRNWSKTSRLGVAFTLLEVMIACGIFFTATFAILALVSQTLRNARVLRHVEVDASMAAAEMFKTNVLFEGSESGDFGNAYPEYTWERVYTPVESNGLWQIDIILRKHGASKPVDTMSILLFTPNSKMESEPGGIHKFP